ncbi:integrase [Bradyrhizobium japonicum]|uniref:tyrosine-type recombinase/integrase n=1 Tax=Bradyrhizobium japonicum TaxID=375 RepID=UPI00216A1BD4|nr:site-specific integrase [Bradyrhizobium japonicum]MCS3498681.1 integrase [Bradyrhizobium japonicum]MCS3959157.1 integrase [Bradyrhizobium japonicum]MCS4000912.1 integrase [Bradyrhizobium japonicum]
MASKLTARKVETAKPGKYSDGGNLYLIVSETGARKWVLRFTWRGRAKEMGLGSAASVPLADAREKAGTARRKIAQGLNPIEERKRDGGIPNFGEMADNVREALSAGFRNEKHKAQWKSTLESYAASLRSKPVDTITTDDVLAVLKPIWTTKAETASRVRGRIEKVLDAAKAKGHRDGGNPARWRGHLDHLLPRPSKLARGHHPAMPYDEVAAFVADLRGREALAARALELCILTAARSGEILGMRWGEIDFEKKVWTVPAHRMKAGREHRVPLSQRATDILARLGEGRSGEFVFPGHRPGKPLSNMAMEMMLRRMKIENATVHGFRSSFRDWAGNETSRPRELIETALAHVIGDKAEQAYRRSDALEKRRQLMEAWATYCTEGSVPKVVPLRGKA